MSLLRIILIAIVTCTAQISWSQSPKMPLSRVINVSGTSQIAPSLSGDGQHMIYTSTSNLKSELLVFYSYQQHPGKWTQPEPVTVINRSLPINHIGGYSLSHDGNYIFFTSRKSYGIGKYDIWYIKRTGANQWTEPVNLAKPVNTSTDEGCPSISPDNRKLYFVRCESMDLKEGTGCRLMMAEKRNEQLWGEPVALPDYINDGNIMSPRILSDNQTLIYAKGQGDDWDLYQTQYQSGKWTKPVSLDYVNTPGDERFASVPATGDVMYYSTKFKGDYDIIKAKIPEKMQPVKVMYLKGEITDGQGQNIDAFVQVYDVDNKTLYQHHQTDGNSGFEFFLAAEKQYDFSVVPLSQGYSFYSELLDLRELSVSTRKKLDITLNSLASGVTFPLECLEFDNDSTLSPASRFELSRIIKFLKNNPGIKAEIAVHREAWDPDSLSQADSLLASGLPYDSAYIDEPIVSESSMHIVDSLETAAEVILAPPPDPTEIRAQAISSYLEERGVPDYILMVKGYADTAPLVAIDPARDPLLNRRIELKIL